MSEAKDGRVRESKEGWDIMTWWRGVSSLEQGAGDNLSFFWSATPAH